MIVLGKRILLVLDNCPAHVAVDIQLSNVTVVFLPPNATSKVQPMDRGIINSFKINYRTDILRKMIALMDADSQTKIDVLQAIYGISSAWNSVTPSCIQNCFRNSGLITTSLDVEVLDSGNEGDALISAIGTSVSFEDYVSVDRHLTISDEPTLLEIASEVITKNNEASTEPQEESDEEIERSPVSTANALSMIDQLKYFVTCSSGHPALIQDLEKLEKFVATKNVERLKQSTIADYFPVNNS